MSILEKIINNWYNRSNDENLDEIDRFISLWISFNAWGCHETNTDVDRNMLDSLKKNQKMKESYNKAKKDEHFSKILSERIGDEITKRGQNKHVKLDDGKSLDSVLDVIYQIRCNLFHGRKDPDTVRDEILIKWAYEILTKIFYPLKNRIDS